jgi:TPR repeat protein
MLASEVLESLHATGVAIALEEGERIVCRARAGSSAPQLGAFLDRNAGVSGRCIRESRPQRVYDSTMDPRVDGTVCRELGIRSLAAVPILHNQQVVGIVEAFSDSPGAFEQRSLHDLTVFAEYAATVVFGNGSDSLLAVPIEFSSDAGDTGLAPAPATASEQTQVEENAGNASGDSQTIAPHRFLLESDSRQTRPTWTRAVMVCGSIAILLAFFSLLRTKRSFQSASTPSSGIVNSASPPGPQANDDENNVRDSQPASSQIAENTKNPEEELRAAPGQYLAHAKAGDVQAQVALADSYAAGRKDHDLVEAGTWYIVAGINGSQAAKKRAAQFTGKLSQFQVAQIRFNVGKMFEDGVGVGPDLISAYSWMVLAQAAGDVRADGEQKKIAEILTPDEVIEAQHRAEQWLADHRLASRTRRLPVASKTPLIRFPGSSISYRPAPSSLRPS